MGQGSGTNIRCRVMRELLNNCSKLRVDFSCAKVSLGSCSIVETGPLPFIRDAFERDRSHSDASAGHHTEGAMAAFAA